MTIIQTILSVRHAVGGVLFAYRNFFGPGLSISLLLALLGTYAIFLIGEPGGGHYVKNWIIGMAAVFAIIFVLLALYEHPSLLHTHYNTLVIAAIVMFGAIAGLCAYTERKRALNGSFHGVFK